MGARPSYLRPLRPARTPELRGDVVNGPLTLAIVAVIAGLLVAAFVMLEGDYEARRDVRRLQRREDARRRLSSPRVMR